MKLGIRQILLDSVNFRHTDPNYLSLPSGKPRDSRVVVTVEPLYSDDRKDVAIRLRVVCEDPESPYAYDVIYTALLTVDYENQPAPADLEPRLIATGGTMAFPFVRELVANLTSRAKFGTSWVAPVNFDKLEVGPRSAAPAAAAP